jgi:hypothetical protein
LKELIPQKTISKLLAAQPGASPSGTQDYQQTAPQLFATLALINKVSSFSSFVRGNFSEKDPPFSRPSGANIQSRRSIELRPRSLSNRTIEMMKGLGWSTDDTKSFEITRWQVLIPFFDKAKVRRHIHFADQTVFPFTEVKIETRETSGAFSSVRKVRIHPAHHNLTDWDTNVRTKSSTLSDAGFPLIPVANERICHQTPPFEKKETIQQRAQNATSLCR